MQFMPRRLSGKPQRDAATACPGAEARPGGLRAVGAWRCSGGPAFVGCVGLQVPLLRHPSPRAWRSGWRLRARCLGTRLRDRGGARMPAPCFRARSACPRSRVHGAREPALARSDAAAAHEHWTPRAFEHPRLPAGHALRPHLLYRLNSREERPSSLRSSACGACQKLLGVGKNEDSWPNCKRARGAASRAVHGPSAPRSAAACAAPGRAPVRFPGAPAPGPVQRVDAIHQLLVHRRRSGPRAAGRPPRPVPGSRARGSPPRA